PGRACGGPPTGCAPTSSSARWRCPTAPCWWATPSSSAWIACWWTRAACARARCATPAPAPRAPSSCAATRWATSGSPPARAAPTFLKPHQLRFRYRLLGLDEAFAETDQTQARFAGLAHGAYRLEVIARSAAGDESPQPAVLAFEMTPAWWERGWARAAAAA